VHAAAPVLRALRRKRSSGGAHRPQLPGTITLSSHTGAHADVPYACKHLRVFLLAPPVVIQLLQT